MTTDTASMTATERRKATYTTVRITRETLALITDIRRRLESSGANERVAFSDIVQAAAQNYSERIR